MEQLLFETLLFLNFICISIAYFWGEAMDCDGTLRLFWKLRGFEVGLEGLVWSLRYYGFAVNDKTWKLVLFVVVIVPLGVVIMFLAIRITLARDTCSESPMFPHVMIFAILKAFQVLPAAFRSRLSSHLKTGLLGNADWFLGTAFDWKTSHTGNVFINLSHILKYKP